MTRKLPLLTLVTLLLGACTEFPIFAELTSTDGTATPPLTTNGQPIAFPKLSDQGGAVFADLAVDAKGGFHAISTEKAKDSGRRQVYYRTSSDAGKTWSAPENLTAGDAESNAGFCRLAIDGQGRVYALWKDDTGTTDLPSGALYRGSLVYRVLSGGAWSATVGIGTEKQAMSWYPSVTPSGMLYLVWNETVAYGDGYSSPAEAGLIKKAPLDGAVPGRTIEVYRAGAVPIAGTSTYHFDGFEGLSGYVDDGLTPHYVVQKAVAQTTEGTANDPQDIVLRLGGFEQNFLKVEQFLKGDKHFIDAPALVKDGSGRHHVVILDSKSDRAGLVDYMSTDRFSFSTVYRLKEKNGRFMGAQVRQGPQGQFVALMELQDTNDQTAAIDLYAARYDGTKWLAPVNLTLNAARKLTTASPMPSASPSPAANARYSAKFATAAWDAQGKVHVMFVATEVGKDKAATEPKSDLYFHTL